MPDHDYIAANRQHFSESSHTADGPGARELSKRLARAILKAYTFDDEETTIMDFACGTGSISRLLIPHAKAIVGVDISETMTASYNDHADNQGLYPGEMRAVNIELTGEPGELGGLKFDVVVCCMAYHHFENISETTRILASFLNPSGKLIVCDFQSTNSSEVIAEEYEHIVPHRSGFTNEVMRSAFDNAGLIEFHLEVATIAKKGGQDVNIFIAHAARR